MPARGDIRTPSRVAGAVLRTRRLNSRSIPWAFTDLVAAAIQCLPSCARPRGRRAIRDAVAQAEKAGAENWPDAARELFARCRDIAAEDVPVLPAGLIGPALDVVWPGACVGSCVDGRAFQVRHAWQTRRDIGTLEADADRSETEEPA